MTNYNYLINLQVLASNDLSRVVSLLANMDNGINRINSNLSDTSNRLHNLERSGSNTFSTLKGSVMGWVASLGLGLATMDSLKTAAQQEAVDFKINFADGSQGANSIEFLDRLSTKLGLSKEAAVDGYASLANGMKGLGMGAEVARTIFQGVSEGAAVMHMSAEQQQGAYTALIQMASKGKISAEELRGQLAERLPGAFSIAADAMGVTESKLNSMLESGEVLSSDFLPKFAKQMHLQFGEASKDAAQTSTANFNLFSNAILDLKVKFGEQLLPIVTKFLNDYVIPATSFIKDHAKGILIVTGAVLGAWAAFKAWNIITSITTLIMPILNVEILFMAISFGILYAPIIGTVLVVGLLIAGFVMLYNKFEGFRGSIGAVIGGFKELVKVIVDQVITKFKGLGEIIMGIIKMDYSLIKKGVTDAFLFGGVDKVKAQFKGIGEAAADGYNDGVERRIYLDTDKLNPLKKYQNQKSTNTDEFVNFDTLGAGNALGDGGGTATDATTKGKNKGIADKAEGINNGGRTSKVINITIGKTVDTVQIYANKVTEGVDEMVDIVMGRLTEAINTANQVQ